jgi:hypothetical protein
MPEASIDIFCVFFQQSFYMDKFGHSVVEIVKDSNIVEIDKLDPNKVCYPCLALHDSFYPIQFCIDKAVE